MKRLLFITMLLSSMHICAVQWERFHYESYGKVDLRGASFTILPADEAISANDPRFQWFAKQAAPYLMLRGANYVPSVENAELVLLLDFGIGETTPRVYNQPVWGRTGISSSSTTIRGNKISTTYTPSWGVIGYQQSMVNQYRKHIEMYLYDANTSEGMSLLWQASIELVGASSNLQTVFPAMMYGMARNGVMCGEANGGVSIYDYDWNPTYNVFLGYSSQAIDQNFVPWRFLWREQTELSKATLQKQEAKQCVIFPRAIIQTSRVATVFFQVLSVGAPSWKISDLSNFYIEYEGQKYYAKEANGLKKGKSLGDYNQRTFSVTFEPLPEEVQYGGRNIAIKEEKKGKIIQGWDLYIEQ